MLPATCRVKFDDPHSLHDFTLLVTPDEGFWLGGRFCFHVFITEEYNMAVSIAEREFLAGTIKTTYSASV